MNYWRWMLLIWGLLGEFPVCVFYVWIMWNVTEMSKWSIMTPVKLFLLSEGIQVTFQWIHNQRNSFENTLLNFSFKCHELIFNMKFMLFFTICRKQFILFYQKTQRKLTTWQPANRKLLVSGLNWKALRCSDADQSTKSETLSPFCAC